MKSMKAWDVSEIGQSSTQDLENARSSIPMLNRLEMLVSNVLSPWISTGNFWFRKLQLDGKPHFLWFLVTISLIQILDGTVSYLVWQCTIQVHQRNLSILWTLFHYHQKLCLCSLLCRLDDFTRKFSDWYFKVHRKMLGHPYSTCVKNDSNFLTYFPVYTEDRCLHECLANVVVGVCNCLPQDRYLEQIRWIASISLISLKSIYYRAMKWWNVHFSITLSVYQNYWNYLNIGIAYFNSLPHIYRMVDMGNIMHPIKWLWMYSSLFDTKSSWSNGSIWKL